MIARQRCKSAGRKDRAGVGKPTRLRGELMARTDNEQLEREIDNLLRSLKRSGENLSESRARLEYLLKLSDDAKRAAKARIKRPERF